MPGLSSMLDKKYSKFTITHTITLMIISLTTPLFGLFQAYLKSSIKLFIGKKLLKNYPYSEFEQTDC